MPVILCLKCRQPPILLDFEVIDTHSIALAVYCPNCEEGAEMELDLWEMTDDHPPHGNYL